ncbi:MAG TPA: septal ring lytic transglycosylase RlpA family protein [Caldimonas sp.]|nr:septal ring lytic transglycosylase RlpA family protein [Caldimonas sp.]
MPKLFVAHGARVLLLSCGLVAGGVASTPALADAAAQGRAAPAREPVSVPATLDRSGRKRIGVASVYARRFAGRKMADGTPMDPHDDNAASKTLPLGTEARVTNLETGKSATVTIQDRGPYVKGRIVDLSPATADKIGITPKDGVAKVEVTPLALPPRGEGARD